MSSTTYDVLIVGGGVSGTALLYELARYTDLKSVGLVEKYDHVAIVNSHGRNNSQTIHCGDIETNYTVEKARVTKRTAGMVVNFATKLSESERDHIVYKYPKMVLAVGAKECQFLRKRFDTFKQLFPNLKLLERDDIAELEPKVVEGRRPDEEIVALGSTDEYTAVNYTTLSEAFVSEGEKAAAEKGMNFDVRLSTAVEDIRKEGDVYKVKTDKGELSARYVVVSAGGHSLLFAHKMGYGLDKSCLPMAGSFYFTPKVLNGKVYTIQNENLPFAAVHGDPDVLVEGKTRFGPTALMLPLLERYNGKTFWEFLKVLRMDRNVVKALWDLMKVRDIRNYIFKNFMFEVPVLRERLFHGDIKKIVPSLDVKDVSFAKGFGGVRPQLIDKSKQKLVMGEAKINPGTGIVFNMTPSPGGTSCLGNAEKDMYLAQEFLGFNIDKETFERDLLTGEIELTEIERPEASSLM
ncbi:MAG: malate:quinone oxidoreductase [Cobetia sp.]|mgnify:FL=1|jgi:malate dehydrogenase (quinone)|uniref:malate dehydrogenase (quinone) n=2 Tax=Cobetia TaxID=204286 RepID=A0AAP4U0V1_9GAMM|nr:MULTISPECIES: FAD-dependent oxidoreductase [Cobetia]AVV34825.1 FAD-dependent oxidoreductase [Halomonas sp. SF2003]MBR9755343.1 FAD-dependent oxidoreductase [Gammaproteobacteria bacterium]TCJ26869.1 FAD-dependent oxidoreductase [Halomonas sp. GDM18]KGA03443.1 malate:quinone oxidoreductase [Cobetia amphilecti]KPM80997.1 malate:quinone oxidoreductase [Cobetia sp. UCD-24C]|tara:strand:+ start:57542 stop:58933 length:1392 start_codon:yes stop_codon:yes gene_type:complete